jgi:hypothetical protein
LCIIPGVDLQYNNVILERINFVGVAVVRQERVNHLSTVLTLYYKLLTLDKQKSYFPYPNKPILPAPTVYAIQNICIGSASQRK